MTISLRVIPLEHIGKRTEHTILSRKEKGRKALEKGKEKESLMTTTRHAQHKDATKLQENSNFAWNVSKRAWTVDRLRAKMDISK